MQTSTQSAAASLQYPDRAGVWRIDQTGDELEVYPLDPMGGMLCIWGPEVGYMGGESDIWDSDEWIGHIPVHRYQVGVTWTFVK